MNKRTAGLILLGISIIIAVLLLTEAISVMTSGLIFAVALAVLGVLSSGFRRS